MTLQSALSDGLNAVPGCEALCYVDLKADLVLAMQSQKRRPQEIFNLMSGLARDVLYSGAARIIAEKSTGSSDIAVLSGSQAVLIFARGKSNPDHALCLLCAADCNIQDVSAQINITREAVAHVM